jgi:hypothetical protein
MTKNASEVSISPASMKMIQLEAAETFLTTIGYDYLNEKERKAIDAAVEHAFDHALEEGIICPGWQMDPGTEGSLAFHAANSESQTRDQIAKLMADKAALLTQVKALQENRF